MSDQYTFKWSSASKGTFTVLPQTTDTTDSPLVLVGRGSPNWGQGLQQNLLYMLENWASATAPVQATTGQLWYNTTNGKLYVYDAATASTGGPWLPATGSVSAGTAAPTAPQLGNLWFDTTNDSLYVWDGTNWDQVYPALSKIPVAYVTEYNAMADQINQIIGTPQGNTLALSYGWNQTNTIPHETISTLTNAKWIAMLTQITNISNFLGLSTSSIPTAGFIYETGNTIPFGITTMLAQYQSTLAAINSWYAGGTRYSPPGSSMESSTPSGGTNTRVTAWNNTITHTVTATFPSAAAMNGFFNSGGQFQFIPSLTNPVTGRDFDYQAFLAARGTVVFNVTGTRDSSNQINSTGFYNLTNAFQTIFAVAGSVSDTYGQPKYQVNAMLVNAYTIQFQIQYTDTGTLYGGVGGTLTSQTNVVRASSVSLASPVTPYPTLTQTAIQ